MDATKINYLTTIPSGRLCSYLDENDKSTSSHWNIPAEMPQDGDNPVEVPGLLQLIFRLLPLHDLVHRARSVSKLWSKIEADSGYSLFYKSVLEGWKQCCNYYSQLKKYLPHTKFLPLLPSRENYLKEPEFYFVAFRVHCLSFGETDTSEERKEKIQTLFHPHQNVASGLLQFALGAFQKNPRERARHYEKACDLGCVEAQLLQGILYAQFPARQKKGFQFLMDARKQDPAKANFLLGIAYSWKKIKNHEMAGAHYKTASEHGHIEAPLRLWKSYHNGNPYKLTQEESWAYLLLSVERDNSLAKSILGQMVVTGLGIPLGMPRDSNKGLDLITQSAKEDDIQSLLFLIGWFFYGIQVPQDLGKTEEYFAQLKEFSQGPEEEYVFHAIALAHCYRIGCGTEKSIPLAIERLKALTIFKGFVGINYGLALCYHEMESDLTKAVQYYKMAAADDDCPAHAYYQLCKFSSKGIGMEQNSEEAKKYFENLSTVEVDIFHLGQKFFYLHQCYQNGYGVEQDSTMAHDLLLKAAERGNASAQFALCKKYALSDKPEHAPLSKQYFKALQDPAHPEIFLEIGDRYRMVGECHLFGYGTEINRKQAAHYLQQAARWHNKEAKELIHLQDL